MEILIILLLILLNGVFAMSEIAMVSARKFRLESAAKQGNSNAKKALDLSDNPTMFLSTVQIGITLIGILTGVFSGEKITDDLELFFEGIAVLQPYASSLAVVVVVVLVTFFSIVFGELIPKRIGLIFPESIATVMAKPMIILSKIASPFIWLLTITNDLFLRLLGLRTKSSDKVTEEEVKAMVQQSAAGGEIEAIEHDIVHRVFALGDRKVSEIMTYRTNIVWFDIHDTVARVKDKCRAQPHSVYPVADGHLDRFLGVVNLKEMFGTLREDKNFSLQPYVRKPLVVYDNTPAYKLLERFREAKWHFALVVNEYGSIQGVITMDDVLDALVGDVSEYQDDEYTIVQRDDNSWIVDGQYSYFELLSYFDISDTETGTHHNTIAGLILHLMKRMPKTGEKVVWQQFELEIMDMDGMRIDKVLMTKR